MTDAPTPRDVIASSLVRPSVYMAGLPAMALRQADQLIAAITAAGYVVVPRDLLTELADDVAAAVAQEFDRTEGYPSMQAKKASAMEPVLRARALIAEGERQ